MTARAHLAEPADYIGDSSAARPASGNDCSRLAFYNIVWDESPRQPRHTDDGPTGSEVGISEVYNVQPYGCIEGQHDKAVSGLQRIGELDFPFVAEVTLYYDAREHDHSGAIEGGYLCVGTAEQVHCVSHMYLGGENNSYPDYVYCVHIDDRTGWVPADVLAIPLFQHLPQCRCLRCAGNVLPLQDPPASSLARSFSDWTDLVSRSRRLRVRRLDGARGMFD
jgi:hypothetical protein